MKKYLLIMVVAVLFLLVGCDREISVTPPDPGPSEGEFSLNSKPENYDVYLNDRISGNKTPVTFSYMEPGEYEVKLHHALYLDTVFTVMVSEEHPVFQVDLTSRPEFYSNVICMSYPSGARIFIDDSSTGKYTPNTISGIYPGNHTVELKKTGCLTETFEMLIGSGLTKTINVGLKDTTVWMTYTKENSNLPSNYLTGVSIMLSNCWASTNDQGIVDFSNDLWKEYGTNKYPMPANMISDIAVNDFGMVVMGSYYGIGIYKNGVFSTLTKDSETWMTTDYITSVSYVIGRLMFVLTTKGGGVYVVKNDGTTFSGGFMDNESLPSQNTTCFSSVSFIGNFCFAVGTDKGVYYQTLAGEGIFNSENSGFISDDISAIEIVDGQNSIYVAAKISYSQGGGIGALYYRDNNSVWTEVKLGGTIVHEIINTAECTWVATERGLYKLANKTQVVQHYTTSNSSLLSNSILDIELNGNALWMATGKGLTRFNTEFQ